MYRRKHLYLGTWFRCDCKVLLYSEKLTDGKFFGVCYCLITSTNCSKSRIGKHQIIVKIRLKNVDFPFFFSLVNIF